MKKYLFIVNPIAGKGKTLDVIPIIKEAFSREDMEYDIRITQERGHGEVLARDGAAKGYTHIISIGGDGTVYEVLNGIKEYDVALGIIPAGTGNDFARTIKLPKDYKQLLEIIRRGKTKKIDVGKINERYFINVASVGIDAEIVKETEKIKKYISGTTAYLVGVFKTLIKFKSKKVNIIIDGNKITRDIELIAVGNGKYYGGGMKITPSAEVEDGLLDICVVNKISKLKFTTFFPTVFKGEHIKIKDVEIFRGKEIKILSDESLSINADGDIIGTTPVEIKVEGLSVEVIID